MNVKETIEKYNQLVDKVKKVVCDIEDGYVKRVAEGKEELLDLMFNDNDNVGVFYKQRLEGRKILRKRFGTNPFNESVIEMFGDGDFVEYAFYSEGNTVTVYGNTESDMNGYGCSSSSVEVSIEIIEAEGVLYDTLIEDYIEERFQFHYAYLESEFASDEAIIKKKKEDSSLKDKKELERLKELYPEQFK